MPYINMIKKTVESSDAFRLLLITFFLARSLIYRVQTSTSTRLIGIIKLFQLDVCNTYFLSVLIRMETANSVDKKHQHYLTVGVSLHFYNLSSCFSVRTWYKTRLMHWYLTIKLNCRIIWQTIQFDKVKVKRGNTFALSFNYLANM